MKNYYLILGVPQDADLPQIKKAYRDLARQYHPDSTSTDQPDDERFIEATEAYRSLSDPYARAKHDHALRQQWRLSHEVNRHQQYLSTDNIKPFMWILVTVLSFAAFMLCVFTVLLIEFSPQKSHSSDNGDIRQLQEAVSTAEAQDRAALNAMLSETDDGTLTCTIDVENHRSDCHDIPFITLSQLSTATPRFRITLNPSVALVNSIRLDFQFGENTSEGATWFLQVRNLRPNGNGDHTNLQIRGNNLTASHTTADQERQLVSESLVASPERLELSDTKLTWRINGTPSTFESPDLFHFPDAEDSSTVDLWFGVNSPLDVGMMDDDLIGTIEQITITIVLTLATEG